jgi:hypothetical protein
MEVVMVVVHLIHEVRAAMLEVSEDLVQVGFKQLGPRGAKEGLPEESGSLKIASIIFQTALSDVAGVGAHPLVNRFCFRVIEEGHYLAVATYAIDDIKILCEASRGEVVRDCQSLHQDPFLVLLTLSEYIFVAQKLVASSSEHLQACWDRLD